MTVTGGPERVFDRPVADLLPELAGATATGENGRVGNELVFWGFRLADNRQANLFACALLENVDCESRLRAVCPAGGRELSRATQRGLIRELDCKAVSIVGTGDLTPNCEDRENTSDLLVGLMECR